MCPTRKCAAGTSLDPDTALVSRPRTLLYAPDVSKMTLPPHDENAFEMLAAVLHGARPDRPKLARVMVRAATTAPCSCWILRCHAGILQAGACAPYGISCSLCPHLVQLPLIALASLPLLPPCPTIAQNRSLNVAATVRLCLA